MVTEKDLSPPLQHYLAHVFAPDAQEIWQGSVSWLPTKATFPVSWLQKLLSHKMKIFCASIPAAALFTLYTWATKRHQRKTPDVHERCTNRKFELPRNSRMCFVYVCFLPQTETGVCSRTLCLQCVWKAGQFCTKFFSLQSPYARVQYRVGCSKWSSG